MLPDGRRGAPGEDLADGGDVERRRPQDGHPAAVPAAPGGIRRGKGEAPAGAGGLLLETLRRQLAVSDAAREAELLRQHDGCAGGGGQDRVEQRAGGVGVGREDDGVAVGPTPPPADARVVKSLARKPAGSVETA